MWYQTVNKKILISLLFISGCQTVNTTNNISVNDEQSIKEIIRINPDFFPEDPNNDENVLEATVPNNGGVVFATVPNNGGVVFVSDPSTLSVKSLNTFSIQAANETNSGQLNRKQKKTAKRPLPQRWGNKTVGDPQRDFEFKFSNNNTFAEVNVKTTVDKELSFISTFNFPGKKKIKNQSVIKAFFNKEDKEWKLDSFSNAETSIVDNKTNIFLENLKFTVRTKDGKENEFNTSLNSQLKRIICLYLVKMM
jgi:hypothetical protein